MHRPLPPVVRPLRPAHPGAAVGFPLCWHAETQVGGRGRRRFCRLVCRRRASCRRACLLVTLRRTHWKPSAPAVLVEKGQKAPCARADQAKMSGRIRRRVWMLQTQTQAPWRRFNRRMAAERHQGRRKFSASMAPVDFFQDGPRAGRGGAPLVAAFRVRCPALLQPRAPP